MKGTIKLTATLAAITILSVSCTSPNETALKNAQTVPEPKAESCGTVTEFT